MKKVYSLIQYCPDRGRMECANVGVIVAFFPGEVLIRMDSTNVGPQRRGFTFDDDHLTLAKLALLNRLKTEYPHWTCPEDIEAFAGKEGNTLLITKPRCLNMPKADVALEELYSTLVKF